jgi:hypothetical protein
MAGPLEGVKVAGFPWSFVKLLRPGAEEPLTSESIRMKFMTDFNESPKRVR